MGSIVSLVGVLVFIIVIFRLLTDGKPVEAQVWKEGEFFEYAGESKDNVSLEWIQASPPTVHTYNELPYIVSAK